MSFLTLDNKMFDKNCQHEYYTLQFIMFFGVLCLLGKTQILSEFK